MARDAELTMRWGRNRGQPFRLVAPRLPKVAVFGGLTSLDMISTELTTAAFNLVRFVSRATACSVRWRVVPTGTLPLLPEHFQGGAYPTAVAEWAAEAESILPQSFVLAAATSPFTPLTAELILEASVGCTIDDGFATLPIVVRAVDIGPGDPVVGLRIEFAELDRDPTLPVTYSAKIVRGGAMGPSCSVGWRLVGTGANPLTAAYFAGAVLPSGTTPFAANDPEETLFFTLSAGAEPTERLGGALLLHTPVGCKIDPLNATRDLSLKPAPVVASPFDLTLANMVVHSPEDAQNGRITWLGGAGGFEIDGDTNDSAHNFAVWFKTAFPDHFEIVYEHELNEDGAGDAGGKFFQFWLEMIGTRSGVPANVAAWIASHYRRSGYDPVADDVYGDFGFGRRISHHTRSSIPANEDEARLVQWNEGTQVRPTPSPDPPTFVMGTVGTIYTITIRRHGNLIRIGKTPGGETIEWVDNGNLARGGGRAGWRAGRGAGAIIRPKTGTPFFTQLDPPDDDGPPTGAKFPRSGTQPWKRAIPVPAVGTSPYIPAATLEQLRAATGPIPPGKQVVQTADINLNGGRIEIDFNGNSAAHSYWRSDRDIGEKELYRRIMNGTVILRGNYGLARGIAFENCKVEVETSEHLQFECNWGYGLPGSSAESGWIFVNDPGNDRVRNLLIGFCSQEPRLVGGWTQCSFFNAKQGRRGTGGGGDPYVPPVNQSRDWLITHTRTDRYNTASNGYQAVKGMLLGRNPNDGAWALGFTIQNWLDTGANGKGDDLIETKFGDGELRDITVIMGSSNDRHLKCRQGRGSRATNLSVLTGIGHDIRRCIWLMNGSGQRTGVSIRDAYAKVRECGVFQGSSQPTASTAHGNGEIELFASLAGLGWEDFPDDPNLPSGPQYRWVNTGKALIGGNHMPVLIKDSFEGQACPNRPNACRVAPADPDRADRNYQIGAWDDDNADPTDFTTPVPDALYSRIAQIQRADKVGPRAWATEFVGEGVA